MTKPPWNEWLPGALQKSQMIMLHDLGLITVPDSQILDVGACSIDLSLSNRGFLMWSGSVKPSSMRSYEEILNNRNYAKKLPLSKNGFVLRRKQTYVFELREKLHTRLAKARFYGQATAKSSIGRLDVLARLIVDGMDTYECFDPGGLRHSTGKMYIEITPNTFSVRVRAGICITQLRFFYGDPKESELSGGEVFKTVLGSNAKDGVLRVDLRPEKKGGLSVSAYCAKTSVSNAIIPLWEKDRNPAWKYWRFITTKNKRLQIERDRFYILRSKERLFVPKGLAIYCKASDETIGEMRIHYAGFVHPGFGTNRKDRRRGTPLIFEVRGHQVNANLIHGEKMANLIFYRMSRCTQTEVNKSYNDQNLKLSNIFQEWPDRLKKGVMETLNPLRRQTGLDFRTNPNDPYVDCVGGIGNSIADDQIRILKELIFNKEDSYPGIDRWFEKKVMPGLRSGERRAYVAFQNEEPIAVAILKLGAKAKLCHLWVNEDHREGYIGQLLFIRMVMDALHNAKELHFTLPESLWDTKSEFFKSFGFLQATKTAKHYRKGEGELACSAPILEVYRAAVRSFSLLLKRYWMTRHGSSSNLLMSVKPSFADMIIAGLKTIEIRKRFSNKWLGKDVFLYSSQPVSSIVGKATIVSVSTDRPSRIWSNFEPAIGCSKIAFDSYVGTADGVTAIELGNVVAYGASMTKSVVSDMLQKRLIPPQSYIQLKATQPWTMAATLAHWFRKRPSV